MKMSYSRHLYSLKGFLCSSLLLFCCARSAVAQEWSQITPPVADAPAVVEFFSFYCPPCFAFSQTLGVDQAIRNVLPEGDRMVKYHVSQLGPLGPELTRAWALAMVMKKTEPVESALFTAGMRNRSLNSAEDIRDVFMAVTGISKEEYDQKINSPEVKEMVELQERLFREYGVTGTPSVNVLGRYHINNAAFRAFTAEEFRKHYSSVVYQLLTGSEVSG